MSNEFRSYEEFYEANCERFKQIDERVKECQSGHGELVKAISYLKKDIAFIQKRLNTMCESIILLEQTVSTEIPTLFDAYSSQHEIQEFDHANVASLNKTVAEHDIRISNLEQANV